MADLDKTTKLALIQNELAGNEQAKYILEVRHRVNKKLGNVEANETVEKELVKIEGTIDELTKILKEEAESK